MKVIMERKKKAEVKELEKLEKEKQLESLKEQVGYCAALTLPGRKILIMCCLQIYGVNPPPPPNIIRLPKAK
jgi:hypothetical protein